MEGEQIINEMNEEQNAITIHLLKLKEKCLNYIDPTKNIRSNNYLWFINPFIKLEKHKILSS